MFQCKKFYVRALVGVLIKRLYEMHGATVKIMKFMFVNASVFRLEVPACSLKKVHHLWPNKYIFNLQEHKSYLTSNFHTYPHT